MRELSRTEDDLRQDCPHARAASANYLVAVRTRVEPAVVQVLLFGRKLRHDARQHMQRESRQVYTQDCRLGVTVAAEHQLLLLAAVAPVVGHR